MGGSLILLALCQISQSNFENYFNKLSTWEQICKGCFLVNYDWRDSGRVQPNPTWYVNLKIYIWIAFNSHGKPMLIPVDFQVIQEGFLLPMNRKTLVAYHSLASHLLIATLVIFFCVNYSGGGGGGSSICFIDLWLLVFEWKKCFG